jgi:hypothetical protein
LNYRTHIVSSLSEIGQAAWDGLVALQAQRNPFLSYAFLHALHESGSAAPDKGWQPQYIVLYEGKAAGSRPRCRSTSRATPTANTCSTGPGPTPTSATASITIPSCSAPSPSRR